MVFELMGLGGMMAFLGAMIGVMIIILLAIYVYYALAMMTIAKKLKYDKPWLAWIPVANMFLFPILADKFWAMGFLLFIPLVNIVFIIMWMWAIYEKRNYPGWLSLVPLAGFIPVLGFIAVIANFVILGLVAWADRK